VKLGVIVPTFREHASDAIETAVAVERSGLDGVFVYDHLWPIGRPDRPSMAPFPLLATLSQRVRHVALGPLVARVGVVTTNVLAQQFFTLESLAPGRVIGALGTGDHLSRPENLAYGLGFPSADERREQLRDVLGQLAGRLPLCVGAGARATNELAREFGADLNFWNADAATLAAAALEGPVSWAGDARSDLEDQLDELATSRVTWAIFSSTVDVDRLARWRGRSRLEQ
jgi:hypothetical protein